MTTTRKGRLSAGEIRFRVSAKDLKRIDQLVKVHELSVSSLLRTLIAEEYERINQFAAEVTTSTYAKGKRS